jgi:hypothetical protein
VTFGSVSYGNTVTVAGLHKQPELTSAMSVSPRDAPTAETIAAVSKLEVWGEAGQAVTFGSLFENQKTVIIFVRACFCPW